MILLFIKIIILINLKTGFLLDVEMEENIE